MKKLILTIAAVTTLIAVSKAQDNETDFREKFTFGLKAGLNYSNVYDSQGEEFRADPKFGLAAGIFVAIPIGKYFGIQPEALISQKGFSATGRILGNTYKFTRTTTYLDVPLFFALKPSEFITILAGPQYSYLLKQSDVFANASTSIEQETEFVNDNIRKNIFGLAVGVDINLKHIVLGARAGWDVTNNNGDGTSTTPRYKNAWYQATIGYRLYSNK
ncbi:MAG: PorT family protein [Sphingobacteriaceae bacterium]|nr:PorT family protein [Sphingobacteriaceae bacterium]